MNKLLRCITCLEAPSHAVIVIVTFRSCKVTWVSIALRHSNFSSSVTASTIVCRCFSQVAHTSSRGFPIRMCGRHDLHISLKDVSDITSSCVFLVHVYLCCVGRKVSTRNVVNSSGCCWLRNPVFISLVSDEVNNTQHIFILDRMFWRASFIAMNPRSYSMCPHMLY